MWPDNKCKCGFRSKKELKKLTCSVCGKEGCVKCIKISPEKTVCVRCLNKQKNSVLSAINF